MIPKNSFRLPRPLEILLALAVLLELIAPFTTNTYGMDGHLHIKMIDQFTHLVSDGVLIPTWVPDGFHGFGAATFYFYPPVTLYVASVFHLLLGLANPYALFQITSLATTVGSFFTARILLKSIGAWKYQMNIGSLLFAFAPFRLVDLYGRSSLSTHVSYMFLPLVWYGLIEIVRQKDSRRIKRIVMLAISCALLALSSVPVVITAFVCIAVAAVAVRWQLTLRILLDASVAALIAAGLCVYHFFSAVSMAPYSHLSNLDGGDPQFLLLQIFHATSIPPFVTPVYYLSMIYAAVGLIAYGYWKSRRDQEVLSNTERISVFAGFAIMILVVYLETPYLSLLVWRYVPGFKLIGFGWRFYPHFLLFAAVMVGIASSRSMRAAAQRIMWISVIGALCPAVMIVFSLHLFAHSMRPPEDPLEYRPIYSAPNDAFIDRLPGKNADFIPVIDEMTRVYAPHRLDPPAIGNFLSGDKMLRTVSKPYYEKYDANLLGPREVTFHRFYWPAWHVYADGHEIISHPDSIGRATAALPAGHYTVICKLEKTPLELAGLWISGISWGFVLLVGGVGLARHNRLRAKG